MFSLYLIILSSRRGRHTSGDIDVIIFHPSHVHVPTPNIPPPSINALRKISGLSTVASKVSKPTKAERESSPLSQGIVQPLEQRGLIAATLSTGVRRWQGVIRVPEKSEDGSWGKRIDRIKKVESEQGVFRRMDLKSVYYFGYIYYLN